MAAMRRAWRGIVGGPSVVKILVADDNSNIQKMVGLALKDQGIDVVAVGNGEAAVRKISDIRPDLVLADVFMPVRNGYEVCQYVKTDASLSHIPVILLVGAFDPLDEQEAQRVGADGVLKKPFVPPDPLISMVKSALARAGVAHPASTAEKAPELQPVKASDFLPPRTAPVPTLASIPVQMTSQEEPIAALDSESFVDEVPAHPEPLKFDAGAQPVAFGSLLETPTEEAEQDPGFLPPVDPELAIEHDWRDSDSAEAEEEEVEEPAATWRPEGAGEAYAGTSSSPTSKDWRGGSFEQIQRRKTQIEDWGSAEETPEVVQAAKTAPVESHGVEQPAESVPVVTAAPFAADAWARVTASTSGEEPVAGTVHELQGAARSESTEQEMAAAPAASASEAMPSEPEKKANGESWFSVTQNPWDAEIQKANRLASAWDSTSPAATPPAGGSTPELTEALSETNKSVIGDAALPAIAVEAIREEAAQVAQDATLTSEQQSAADSTFYKREEEPETAAQPPAPSMDDLVAKVLAKMSPDALQAVTREILKPVVEAMIREEMKSKKS